MVFTNLTPADKEAFFSLLDEYFETRGHRHGLAALSAAATGANGPVAAERLSNASTALRSGLNHHLHRKEEGSAGAESPADSGDQATTKPSFHQLRDAFASAHGSATKSPVPSPLRSLSPVSSNKSPTPPVAPRRTVDMVKEAATSHFSPPRLNAPAPPPTAPRRQATTDSKMSVGSTLAGLTSTKKFGSIDVEKPMSARIGGAISNFASGGSAKSSPAPAYSPPQALPTVKHSFAPPPARRAPSGAPPPPAPKRAPTPEPEPESEPEPEGEWAEALYAYTSDDKGDLQFSASERVLVIERTSEDWWTGQLAGKTGLFPASYVKVL